MNAIARQTGLANVLRRSLLAIAGMALLAACTGGGGPGWTFVPPQPTPSQPAGESPGQSPSGSPAGSPAGSPGASPSDNTIQLDMTADLRYKQGDQVVDELSFVVGEEYTFVVENVAGFSHDIFLGPPDQLAASDTEGLPGIPAWETGEREFTWTATEEAQGWDFGCTVPGHYPAGMRGSVVLEGP